MFMLWGWGLASTATEFIEYDEYINQEGWAIICAENQSDFANVSVADVETGRRRFSIHPTTAYGYLSKYSPDINIQSTFSNASIDNPLESPSDLAAHHSRGSSRYLERIGTGTEVVHMDGLPASTVACELLVFGGLADGFGETEHNLLGTSNRAMLEPKENSLPVYQQDQCARTGYQSNSCSTFEENQKTTEKEGDCSPAADGGDPPLPFPSRHVRQKPPKLDQDLMLRGLAIPFQGLTTLQLPESIHLTVDDIAHASVEGSERQLSYKVDTSGVEPLESDGLTVQQNTIQAIMLAGPKRTIPENRELWTIIDRLAQFDDEWAICDNGRPMETEDGLYTNVIGDQVLIDEHRLDLCETSELSLSVPEIKNLTSNGMAQVVLNGNACSPYHLHDHSGTAWPPDMYQPCGHDDPWTVFSIGPSRVALQ